jgi:hypothetical protein
MRPLVGLACIAIAASCGTSAHPTGFRPGGGGSAGTIDSGVGDDASLVGDGSAGCSGERCSTDLHSVIDCKGQVVTRCADDQGCAAGKCVAACASAAAAKGTVGCEFYAVDPDIVAQPGASPQGACFAAFVANTWGSAVTLSGDWGGQPIDMARHAYTPNGTGAGITYQPLQSSSLPPGQVAIVFLNDYPPAHAGIYSSDFECPSGVSAATTTFDGAVHGTGRGKAFHIRTDRPVAAYDIFPFGGGQSAVTSATLLVPTASWDVNYIAVNAYARNQNVLAGQGFVQVVASEANTTVTIQPKAAIAGGGGVAPTPANAKGTYVLANPGDYLQLTQDAELTGSPILADKPVGVWGGSSALNVDVTVDHADSAHQQLFPVKALGHEYVAARYRDRYPPAVESVPYRIVGAVAGTALSYDPAPPQGAPTHLDAGQVATFWTSDPFVVRSQDDMHPFYVSAHMTGAATFPDAEDSSGNTVDARGDPEFVNVVPAQEYLSSYVFFTDPTYPETNLVVVRAGGPSFADVTLDCLGTLTGWTPVGTSGAYEYTRVDLSTGDFQAQGNCDNGRHVMSSTQPFGLTVWGWGTAAAQSLPSQWVSYAYPGGASAAPINSVVVTPNQ